MKYKVLRAAASIPSHIHIHRSALESLIQKRPSYVQSPYPSNPTLPCQSNLPKTNNHSLPSPISPIPLSSPSYRFSHTHCPQNTFPAQYSATSSKPKTPKSPRPTSLP
ncbi:hypothetical protein K469DRAFT_703552 [Zopfia rhizophila CBS 207.26]|uniref:Uncharacterized protein n=1 Tax=Zopfia rhizophila CBS 207.26 TaxID=1314779 RepID=A0A6A6E815_9PEZI|nr:hypothetical protein K469DRAFT_703552 [Zopfia rhizophila CBS 207.26]